MEGNKMIIEVKTDKARALVTGLSWDSEEGERAQRNLLRSPGVSLRLEINGEWQAAEKLATVVDFISADQVVFHLKLTPEVKAVWSIQKIKDCLLISLETTGQKKGIEAVGGGRLVFPFNPEVTSTTVLSDSWDDAGPYLPAIISAPDFGQMLVTAEGVGKVKGRLEGNRRGKTVDYTLCWPALEPGQKCVFKLTPVYLPPPEGMKDIQLWQKVRRGWFNVFQPCVGQADEARGAPVGLLCNNVISDPVSSALWLYADMALWTPELAPGVSSMAMIRRTLDWNLDSRILPSGAVIAWLDIDQMLDSNPSILIAAWDYVEATSDMDWLAQQIDRLEVIGDFTARCDTDQDGIVEAKHSGNRSDTITSSRFASTAMDTLNAGHKITYANTLIYRGWRCLAELEDRLGRREKRDHYTALADRLKAAFPRTFMNPETGWLAMWKSVDGELHDYGSPWVNSIAVEHGLVNEQDGREILARLQAKLDERGFRRYDLGIPFTLIPIRRDDYSGRSYGRPEKEDGSDTFGWYLNGGVMSGAALHYLNAHYVSGENERADHILEEMLKRQDEAKFQNGVVDRYPHGVEFTTWDGRPAGYEGYLCCSFAFLQCVLLREPSFRSKLYRPLMGELCKK